MTFSYKYSVHSDTTFSSHRLTFNLKFSSIMLIKLMIFVSFLQFAIGDELTDLANSTRNTLKIYSENDDNSIPWKNLTKFVEILNLDMKDYSREAVGNVINIRDSTRRGLDIYFEQTRKVYGWAVSAELNFRAFLRVNVLLKFDNTTTLLNVLSRGVDVLKEAIDKMDDIAAHFSDATMHVERLEDQLQKDTQANSSYLKNKISDYRINSALIGGGVGIFLGLIPAIMVADGTDAGNGAAAGIMASATATGAGSSFGINELFILDEIKERLAVVENMYATFKQHTSQVFESIQNSKQKLRDELKKMEGFKSKVESGRDQFIYLPFIKEVHGPIISSLVTECEDYVKRHSS